jgi:hypothetical protein
MRRLFSNLAALALAVGAAVALPASAATAAETESAALTCGTATYTVTGFGRGQVLHVANSERIFVVLYAELHPQGRVVYDNPGQGRKADEVSCTTTSPSGQEFLFRGFFTPRS